MTGSLATHTGLKQKVFEDGREGDSLRFQAVSCPHPRPMRKLIPESTFKPNSKGPLKRHHPAKE